MKAWRFYGFNDLRMDETSLPVCKPHHVIVKVQCVQPSVTEAQLARGIKTLAYERIKKRLETEAPVQLFGHELWKWVRGSRSFKSATGSRHERSFPVRTARSAFRAG